MKTFSLFYAFFCITNLLFAQEFSQNIRGRILDGDSKQPLIGANILIVGSEPIKGATTDYDGYFSIEKVAIGRYDLLVKYIGYEDRTISNVLVNAGKETVVNVELLESTAQMEEVVITATKEDVDKSVPLNEMATLSARSFTVEETKRYAGSFNDPARMASSYAGVASGSNGGNNDIVVRGNSPKGMLWRLEGIEIPNPNHFANEGASGGPISIINSDMLDNSDFYTSAFPAEYGNAYSGVFDLNLRKGNANKREYGIQAGFLGIDATAEGYFKKESKASYVANYRYATVAMLNLLGINVAGDAVPTYTDGSFKIYVPTKKAGEFSIFGIGGKSFINQDYKNKNDVRYAKEKYSAGVGAFGVQHQLLFSEKSSLKSTLLLSTTTTGWDYKKQIGQDTFERRGWIDNQYYTFRGSVVFNHKFNARHRLQMGAIRSNYYFDLKYDEYDEVDDRMKNYVTENNNSALNQVYTQWKWRITDRLTLNSGVHALHFELNDDYSIEPRVGLKWFAHPKHAFSIGFGMHSRIESISHYFARVESDGVISQPNKNMKMSRARHYVMGYDAYLTENLHFKTEIYYQDLYKLPVEEDSLGIWALLNRSEGFVQDKFVNKGRGYNYGVEFTLERFFSNRYYFMITTSIFESKYKALDGVWRNTRFNNRFVSNVLAGKEWDVSRNGKQKTFTTSFKMSWAGGFRYTPIDLQKSIDKGEAVYITDKAWKSSAPNYYRLDMQLSLRVNKKRTTRFWMLDMQNLTNNQNLFAIYYDNENKSIENATLLGFLPVLSYKVIF
ncbi:MAG: carboxypeptidase-like regulatory domain-containing protein [Flammeovirgaceae bacterium]